MTPSPLQARAAPIFETRLACTPEDTLQAQRLRYRVFVEELGASGAMVDHQQMLERDKFDAVADQLLLIDRTRTLGDQVVGVYRVMDSDARNRVGSFYSSDEYDLSGLERSGRRLLELGRSCLHAEYRGGGAMMHLWQGLAGIVRAKQAEVLFGVASFRGTDVAALAQPLSLLSKEYTAPQDLFVRSKNYQTMQLTKDINRVAAMGQVPSLIKAYLRLGGFVGDGAYVDHAFNTTDVCLILDVARMEPRHAQRYAGNNPERMR